MKGIQMGEEEVKLLLFADDMILYKENPKDTTHTHTHTHTHTQILELINEFSKVAEYKINIQMSVTLLFPNKKLSKKKLRKQSHLQPLQKNKNKSN